MTLLTLSALAVVLLIFGKSAQGPINRFLGTGPGGTGNRGSTTRVLALLVVIALVLVIDPELRLLLMFVDAVGIDFFLLLVAIQGRELFALLHSAVIMPAVHYLSALGPYPLPLPGRWLLTQHPFWAVYSVAQFVAVTSAIACLVTLAAVGGASAAVGSFGKALSGALLPAVRPKRMRLSS